MRPSCDSLLMDTAWLWSRRSTCSRLNVGAVVAKDTRILSQGYNGAPSGLPHCPDPHEEGPCRRAVHAEANALMWAARQGIRTEGSDLYCTHQPCLECSRLIINAGIGCVFYDKEYRDSSGVSLLDKAGVEVFKI